MAGMGPVPFAYSAEAFPLHIREIGRSFATATTWCFNFILSFTWPSLVSAFKNRGAFGWYAAWCILGWIGVALSGSNTSTNALHYAFRTCTAPRTRLLALLQAVAWAAGRTGGDRADLRDVQIAAHAQSIR